MGNSNIKTAKADFRQAHGLGDEFQTVKDEMEELQNTAPSATGVESVTIDTNAQTLAADTYHTKMTGSGAGSQCALPNGSIVGERRLLTAVDVAADDINLSETNIHNSAGTQATGVVFDADNEYLLLEWTGAEWQEIYGTATISTT